MLPILMSKPKCVQIVSSATELTNYEHRLYKMNISDMDTQTVYRVISLFCRFPLTAANYIRTYGFRQLFFACCNDCVMSGFTQWAMHKYIDEAARRKNSSPKIVVTSASELPCSSPDELWKIVRICNSRESRLSPIDACQGRSLLEFRRVLVCCLPRPWFTARPGSAEETHGPAEAGTPGLIWAG